MSAGETNKEGGGGTASVGNVLLGGAPGSITLWGRDLDLVGGNVPEAGRSACGLPKSNCHQQVLAVLQYDYYRTQEFHLSSTTHSC